MVSSASGSHFIIWRLSRQGTSLTVENVFQDSQETRMPGLRGISFLFWTFVANGEWACSHMARAGQGSLLLSPALL